jgi:hypothetical protein
VGEEAGHGRAQLYQPAPAPRPLRPPR